MTLGNNLNCCSTAELDASDKLNLDIFWLKDDGHINHDGLLPPNEVALEIVENLEMALENFVRSQ